MFDKIKSDHDFLLEVKGMHAGYFEPAYIAEHFSIPSEYMNTLGTYDIEELHSYYGITINTKYGIDNFGDSFLMRKEKKALHDYDVMFIVIGAWGDKHDFHLCVDTSSTHYGKVFDFNDAHPWFGRSEPEVEWESFKEFLKDEFEVE